MAANSNTPAVFAPRAAARSVLSEERGRREIGEFVQLARVAGGRLAGWRIARTMNAGSAALVADAVKAHFEAKRDELLFRTALGLDNAKKRAIADSLEDTAVIEREIARMTAETTRDLSAGALDVARDAALEEMRRIRELGDRLERNEITRSRHDKAVRSVEAATDDICQKSEAVAQRVIENLGVRLEEALRLQREGGG